MNIPSFQTTRCSGRITGSPFRRWCAIHHPDVIEAEDEHGVLGSGRLLHRLRLIAAPVRIDGGSRAIARQVLDVGSRKTPITTTAEALGSRR